MRKINYLILSTMILILLSGCGKNLTTNDTKQTKGKCEVTECINQIKPENTVEEINSIIGFSGELIDEKYNKYYWELGEDIGVEVTYYSSDKGTIKIDFDEDTVANKKVSFSKYDEIKSALNNGQSLTYNEFISKVGNVEGTLVEKSSYSKSYIWVNSDGGYLKASFSETNGKCSYMTGSF